MGRENSTTDQPFPVAAGSLSERGGSVSGDLSPRRRSPKSGPTDLSELTDSQDGRLTEASVALAEQRQVLEGLRGRGARGRRD